jgi:hypothetical protein
MGYNYPPKRKRMISQEVLDEKGGYREKPW